MNLQSKIELIQVLQEKLYKGKSSLPFHMTEEQADQELTLLKNTVIEKAKEESQIAEQSKRIKDQIKRWCQHHNIDHKILEKYV